MRLRSNVLIDHRHEALGEFAYRWYIAEHLWHQRGAHRDYNKAVLWAFESITTGSPRNQNTQLVNRFEPAPWSP